MAEYVNCRLDEVDALPEPLTKRVKLVLETQDGIERQNAENAKRVHR